MGEAAIHGAEGENTGQLSVVTGAESKGKSRHFKGKGVSFLHLHFSPFKMLTGSREGGCEYQKQGEV